MADRKSAQYPHQWPDGSWHSNTWAAHQAAMKALPVGNVNGLGAAAAGPVPVKGVTRPLDASPPAAAAGAAAAPAGGGAPAAGGSAQIVPDAQFLAEAAQRAFERTTQINSYTKEGVDDRGDSAEAIRRILEDSAGGKQTIKEGANKQGLFYSGQLSKNLGTYDAAITRATGDISTQLQHREDARTAAIGALQQGAPLEEASALAAAGTRQIARDTTAADANALVPNMAAPVVPGATAVAPVKPAPGTVVNTQAGNPRAGQAFTTKPGQGGTWHVYPGKAPVWVPKRK